MKQIEVNLDHHEALPNTDLPRMQSIGNVITLEIEADKYNNDGYHKPPLFSKPILSVIVFLGLCSLGLITAGYISFYIENLNTILQVKGDSAGAYFVLGTIAGLPTLYAILKYIKENRQGSHNHSSIQK